MTGRSRPLQWIRQLTVADVLVLVVVISSVFGLLAGVVGATTTVISFEELDDGTQLTTQYEDHGVVFEVQAGASTAALINRCGPEDVDCRSARDGQNVVVTPVDFEFTREPLVASFTVPQQAVEISVREVRGLEGSQTATLVARNTANEVVADRSVQFDPNTGWHRIGVSTDSAAIAEVTLTLAATSSPERAHNFFVADGLRFRTNDPPSATFTVTPETPTVDDPVSFDASESFDPDGEVVTYRWNFGDGGQAGSPGQGRTTTHVYDEPGTYSVTLEVVDDDGATAQVTQEVTVADDPVARCTVSDRTVASGEKVLINASESNADLIAIDVDGDGTFERTNEEDFREAVSYADPGEVEPVVRAEIESRTQTRTCPTITVNQPPRAEVDASSENPTVGESVRFDAAGSDDPDGELVAFRWFVDGDEVSDSPTSTARMTHTFTEGGRHTVGVLVVDDSDAADRAELSLEVNEPPVAAISLSGDPTVNESVRLDASASSDPDGRIVRYAWDVTGDDAPDRNTSSPSIRHVFSGTDRKTISLLVVDNDGAVGRAQTTVRPNNPPQVGFAYSPSTVVFDYPAYAEPMVDESVRLDASESFDPDGEVVEFRWDFNGDGVIDESTTTPHTTHTFEDGGTHGVVVYAVDDDGAVTQSRNVVHVSEPLVPSKGVDLVVGATGGLIGALVVREARSRLSDNGNERNTPPNATIISLPELPAPGRPVLFDGSLSVDPDTDDRIIDYRWTMGDDHWNGPRFVHVFTEGGEYEVELTVTDTHGATDTDRDTVRVSETGGDLTLVEVHPDVSGSDTKRMSEYLTFENAGDGVLDLCGWAVYDAAGGDDGRFEDTKFFEFPEGLDLAPGERVTVHTGPESGAAVEKTTARRHCFASRETPTWNSEADTVVVRDERGGPVTAERYEQTDADTYETEPLDVEVLQDLFIDVELSRRENDSLVHLGLDTGFVPKLVSDSRSFVAGAVLLRGPHAFIGSWTVILSFVFSSGVSWAITTWFGAVPRSIKMTVPVILVALAAIVTVFGGIGLAVWKVLSALWGLIA